MVSKYLNIYKCYWNINNSGYGGFRKSAQRRNCPQGWEPWETEENKERDYSKTSEESFTNIPKEDDKTKSDFNKKEIQDKPLPQIKQINISNLLKNDKVGSKFENKELEL